MKSLLNFQSVSPIMILTVEEGTDPRPLYFIPYDPNIEQSREEQMLSRRILYERFLSHVLSKIGPVNAPCEVILTTEEMLISATFGVYEIWEDQETRKHLRRLLRDFMGSLRNTLNDGDRKYMKYETAKGWVFEFKNQNIYEKILTQISKFKPGDLDLSKTIDITQLDLFETLFEE